jgi:hypothetical protein
VLARIHKMNSDLLELFPRSCSYTFVMEGIVLVKLIYLQLGCTLPLVIAMKLVEPDGIIIILSDLVTVHVLLAGLVGHRSLEWFTIRRIFLALFTRLQKRFHPSVFSSPWSFA